LSITIKQNKMTITSTFTHWTIQDLWKQYQYCQENKSNFNRIILNQVIKEIKNRKQFEKTI